MAGSVEAQRRAMKLAHEGAEMTQELIAEIAGKTPAWVRRVAIEDGWREAEDAMDEPERQRRLQRAADRLLREIDADGRTKSKARLTPARIDQMLAAVRTIGKITEMRRPQEGAAKEEPTDEEVAAALALINGRIVELARHYAGELVGEGVQPAPDGGSRP